MELRVRKGESCRDINRYFSDLFFSCTVLHPGVAWGGGDREKICFNLVGSEVHLKNV